jgi:hypothetical protein
VHMYVHMCIHNIFMWFVHKGVMLTKDNSAKRRWKGSKCCCLCDQEATIRHLFLKSPLAKLCRPIHVSFNVPPSNSISNLFGNWLGGLEPNTTAWIRVRLCALLWAIWNCQNDCVFSKTNITKKLQVINWASGYLHVVINTPCESEWAYGLSVQPMDSTVYVQPV